MRLELDAGNTRVKWRMLADGQSQAGGALAYADYGELDALWSQIPVAVAPDSVWVANVAGAEVWSSLRQYALTFWGLEPAEACVSERAGGVSNAYADYARLGVDRWLAMLAAFNAGDGAHLVVDCGSAVTVDLVSHEGEHLGGYIVPGLGLMHRALFKDTDAVKVVAAEPGEDCAPGVNTMDAVNHGLPLMVVGLVSEAEKRLRSMCGAPVNIWVTGGDGELLVSLLPEGVRFSRDLVLDGLAYVDYR